MRKTAQQKDPRMETIVQRIEEVRGNRTKTAFARDLGMSSQTYNNLTGIQGSAPNTKLILTVCSQFCIESTWLLFGSGQRHFGGCRCKHCKSEG